MYDYLAQFSSYLSCNMGNVIRNSNFEIVLTLEESGTQCTFSKIPNVLKIQFGPLSKILSTQVVLQIHFNFEVLQNIIFDQPYFHSFLACVWTKVS